MNNELSIDHKALAGAKLDFDIMLRGTVQKMISQRAEEGTVTLKLEIKILTGADVATGEVALMPVFSGEVSANIPQKEKEKLCPVGGHRLDFRNGMIEIVDPQVSMDEILTEKK